MKYPTLYGGTNVLSLSGINESIPQFSFSVKLIKCPNKQHLTINTIIIKQ